MPSTRRQKAKARRSREMDIIFLLGGENVNPIERELAKTINGSISHNDLESVARITTNPTDENENRDFSHEGQIPRQDKILNSMRTFSYEIKMRLSQEMDAMMSMMPSQIY